MATSRSRNVDPEDCRELQRARGSRVVVEAELDWREWTDQHGANREAVTFKARQVLFEGGRRMDAGRGEGEGEQGKGLASSAQPAVDVGATAPANESAASADDLPF